MILFIIKLLTSPIAWMMLFMGVMCGLAIVPVANVAGWSWPRRFLLAEAQKAIGRSCLFISSQGEFLHRSITLNEDGTAEVIVDGARRVLSDPDDAMAWLKGAPFALAHEDLGVLYDPRHAWIGSKTQELQLNRSLLAPATEDEARHFGVRYWYRAVVELPRELTGIDPSAVRYLATGGESSNDGRYAREFYKNSRQPKADHAPMSRLLIPVASFIAPMLGMWFMRSQMGSGGGGTVISYGSLLPLAIRDRDWRTVAKWTLIAGGVVVLAIGLGVALSLNAMLTLLLILPLGAGIALVALTPTVLGAIDRVGPAIGTLYWRVCLLGVSKPDLVWRRGEYRLMDGVLDRDECRVGRLYGSYVAVGFDPDEAFDEVERGDRVLSTTEGIDQVGEISSKIPEGHYRSDAYRREEGDQIGGFVPVDINPDAQYVRLANAWSRLAGGMDGESTQKKWQQAKEEFGMNAWMASDVAILKMSFLSMLAGGTLGTVLFFGDVVINLLSMLA